MGVAVFVEAYSSSLIGFNRTMSCCICYMMISRLGTTVDAASVEELDSGAGWTIGDIIGAVVGIGVGGVE